VFDSVVLGARDWLTATVILVAFVSSLAVWSYTIRSQLSVLKLIAMALKLLAIAALAFCLLEPMQRSERPLPGANVMAIVVDNSRSMEIRPPGETKSRIERIKPGLDTQSAWQARLAQDFDVRRYAFDDRLRAVEDLSALEFDGNNSSLADAITTLQSRFSSRSVAGMLLYTDGLATDDLTAVLAADEFPFPLYPVIDDAETRLRDVSIQEPTVVMSSFELAPASVEATVSARGMAGKDLVVRLLDPTGETLDRQTLTCESDEFERRVRFQFQPSAPGLQMVEMRAMLASEDRDDSQLESRLEVTTANNSRLFAVDRGGGPYRVLYVSGRPNWEFKFIRRALEEDVELVFHGLVRIARKEPKFSFGDRDVDSANPLLSGFGNDEETVEQYDEPVLVKIGEGSAEALKAGFPSGEEDLFAYHAIILDDVEADFFTPAQMQLMREFVATRGGGLMMLGGQESFLAGGYRDTPLGDVLPVYLRGNEGTFDKNQPVRYRLTREGALQPWLRLRPNQVEENKRFEEMPDFLTWNAVADLKPGASLLAEVSTTQGNQPGLVAQRFGKGRSLALLVGDFWRWSMRRATEDTDDLAQSWRQIARWLTSDVPRRVEVDIQPPAGSMEAHRLTVVLRDAAYKPQDNATVNLTVTEPDGREVDAMAIADPTRPGVYQSEYWSAADGGYRCKVESISPDGEPLDVVNTGWTAQPSAAEFARIEPDISALEKLANNSGGELVPIKELDAFVASLPTRKVPVTEVRVEPLWHRPWLILVAIGCLCGEWGLRRWKGLP
jgi:uncharacterized membrane protein